MERYFPCGFWLFDRLGVSVASLEHGTKEPGEYTAIFDGTRLPSGYYQARLKVVNPRTGKVVVKTLSMAFIR